MAEKAENNSNQAESLLLKDVYALAYKLRWILICATLLFPPLYYYFDYGYYPKNEATTTIYISSGRQYEFYEMLLTRDAYYKAITHDPEFLVEVREKKSGDFSDQFSFHVHREEQTDFSGQFTFKTQSKDKLIAAINGNEIEASFGVPFSVNGTLVTVTAESIKPSGEYEVKIWSPEEFLGNNFGSLEIEQLENSPHRVKMLYRDDNPNRAKKMLDAYIAVLKVEFSGPQRDSIRSRIEELEKQILAKTQFFDEEKIITSREIDDGKVNNNIKTLSELQLEQATMERLIEKISMSPQMLMDTRNRFTPAEKGLIIRANGQEFLNKLAHIDELKNALANDPRALSPQFAEEWTASQNYIIEKLPELVSKTKQSLGSFGKEAEAQIAKMLFATEPTSVVNYSEMKPGKPGEWKQSTIALLDLSAMIQEKVKLQSELHKIQPEFKVMQQPYAYEISNVKNIVNRLVIGVAGFFGIVLTMLFIISFLRTQIAMARSSAETNTAK